MAIDAGFWLFSTRTPAVRLEISMQPPLINTGVDKVASIIGSDISITNGCLGCYLGTAPVLTVTLCWLGGRCSIQKNDFAQK